STAHLITTITSIPRHGTWIRLIWTAMVKPIMLENIVERLDQVRSGFLSPFSTAFSTFFSKCRSIKEPFLRERGMAYPLKLFATATYDEFISTLVAAGLLKIGRASCRERV